MAVEMPLGLPAESLNEVACRHGAELIVVGSHGQSLWREGVLGCFTCAVLHNTQYPVLLFNVRLQKPGQPGSCQISGTKVLRHVLLPTDFSEIRPGPWNMWSAWPLKDYPRSRCSMPWTCREEKAIPRGIRRWPQGRPGTCGAMEARLLQAGVPLVNDRFDPGHPIPAILEVLESQDISLIIMGTQGKGFIKEIFLGSVAHNISRLAMCPVLLIPPASRG